MSGFSTMACYAALTSCTESDLLQAYARMVAGLIKEKRYEVCDVENLTQDFYQHYGFSLPYHPMVTVLGKCVDCNFLSYNSYSHKYLPNYGTIDGEDFMEIVNQKNEQYQNIITEFSQYLIETYDIHLSNAALNEQIVAFIEHYGIETEEERKLQKLARNEFLFADFLVACEESGKTYIIDYLNDYIVGLCLTDVLTYCEQPEKYTSSGTSVFLDTGILFRLFGIDSSNHAQSYAEFLSNMRHIGMRIKVYEHTLNEMIGIVENAKYWIGNPDYDDSLSSDATRFFVSNNWTVNQVSELSSNIRYRVKEDFNIDIDTTPYPKVEDIRTFFEAEIKERIIQEYKASHPTVSIQDIEYSIDQDAKSIFFTQHKNGNIVPYHINDVRNVFVTMNRSLARVGHSMCYDIATSKEQFIPTVMTDIKWGTLIWFNNPATISSLNRPRLVSAAYAAFRPSPEVTRKLNATLSKLNKEGRITPEQCYLLKVSPIAQRILSRKTINDPDKFVDETPLEILAEMERNAYIKGSLSRQSEIETLSKEKEKAEHTLALERQQRVVADKRSKVSETIKEIETKQKEYGSVSKQVEELEPTRQIIEKVVNKRYRLIRIMLTIIAIAIAVAAFVAGSKYSWIVTAITFVFAVVVFCFAMWKQEKTPVLSMVIKWRDKIYDRQCQLRRYSEESFISYKQELERLETEIAQLKSDLEKENRSLNDEIAELERIEK